MTADTTARAVNAHLWARHPEEYYVEPDWCDDAIFHQERFDGPIHDPACGSGRIVRAARRAGYEATGTDIVRRCDECEYALDFLESALVGVDNIVCNPPFKIANEFVTHSLALARRKVAMILPARYVFGETRSRWLATTPLRRVLSIVPRPSMPPGPVIEAGIRPEGGKQDFVVCVWLQNYDGPIEFGWLRRPPANDNLPIGGDA